MSAFVVGQDHIDFLVSAAIDLGTGGGYGVYWKQHPGDGPGSYIRVGLDNADEFGAMLLAENIASVSYRYPDDDVHDLPGPIPTPSPATYKYRRFTVRDAYTDLTTSIARVLKAVACYEYQSCEHPHWKHSEAKRVCEQITSGYINRLPGYDEAQWEVERPAHAMR